MYVRYISRQNASKSSYCYRLINSFSLSSNSIGNSIVLYLGTLGIQKAIVIFVV